MGWIFIDKKEAWREIGYSCPRMASVCQGINAILMTCISFCLANDSLGFIIGCLWNGFNDLDATQQSICMGDIRLELMQGFVISSILILVLWLICVLFAWYAKKFLGKETKKLEKTIKRLERNLAKYQSFESGISSVVKIYFASVAKRCGLDVTERVSFYVLQNKNQLALSERYATNPDYQTVSRETYPDTEGIISLARRKISVMIENLPDYDENLNDYLRESKTKFNLSAATVKNLTMKARFYYAYRFSSPDQRQYNGIAVIESMNPHFRQKAPLDEIFTLDNDFIYNLVDIFKEQLPRLKISKDKEF